MKLVGLDAEAALFASSEPSRTRIPYRRGCRPDSRPRRVILWGTRSYVDTRIEIVGYLSPMPEGNWDRQAKMISETL